MQPSNAGAGSADPAQIAHVGVEEIDAWEGLSPEDARRLEELGYVAEGGWQIVDTARGTSAGTGFTPGARDAGMSAHRGVLHPDEYVDSELLASMVENALGFTLEEVHSVYRQGVRDAAKLELRARIDARLLEVAEAGGNMLELAKAFGWSIEDGDAAGGANCRTMERALARARAVEEVAA